jgi:hypothetical protein
METKCKQHKPEGMQIKLGFDRLFVVDLVGRSGGLALLWKESEGLEIQNFTCRHINAVIKLLAEMLPGNSLVFIVIQIVQNKGFT